MSVYGMKFEDIPSPIEELKDIPFSRISKTIMKSMEEREEVISTPRRRNYNNYGDISPSSISVNFSRMELNDSSPSSKGKKPEKTSKMCNARKLNEKYAIMQQKMTHMVQEITYPKAISSRNSKNLQQRQRDEDQSGMIPNSFRDQQNPFFINSSNTNNLTAGSLMGRWLSTNSNKRKLTNFIEDLEQDISSDRIEHTPSGNEQQHIIKWKNDNPPKSFTSCNTFNTSRDNVSTLGSMTPNFRNRQERSGLQTTPIKKARLSQPSPFSTPVHSPKPSFIVRKRARRIAPICPPPKLNYSEKANEDEIDSPLASPSPSPYKGFGKDDSLLDNSRYDQTSPSLSEINIYTRQLSQQNLSYADAARNPIFTEATIESIYEFFQSVDNTLGF
ncbi:unnamed protein product [Rhizophagus irregularis]|uniref:Uncharacterized protein n=1 Tax=Rhizophagus irregularis TaxID=588596 RepID=A0A2N1MY91_9GLOM|nr:hypothetical protein RhiirC2_784558 [Rhizophagus irregularis]CAB4395691.1 unnamed protein product [Rhizophagus irregularis]CAB5351560.1 unnamed protein product [Rhizophagus irregularis]